MYCEGLIRSLLIAFFRSNAAFAGGELNCAVLAGGMDQENSLTPADPLCNVVEHRLKEALEYYASPSTPQSMSPQNSREQNARSP